MDRFRCEVKGRPATQGSMKGFVIPAKGARKARAIVTHGRDTKIVAWRQIMHCAFQSEMARVSHCGLLPDLPAFSGAVCVLAEVVLPRLSGHPKTPKGKAPGPPTGKGDLDKHQRAIGDSLTSSGVLADDGLICQWVASKRYAAIGEEPGVVVEVTPL